ncbi:hypothetical protein BV898_11091 [Hypsibius exemplaris]|uniref:Uncharacterized protein n=1 Tax=Hypsibius exemplaris TaxID=2072580 RepID=A0A1W0WHQ6_HYPEX|nr:hypothetical protein BV898_11091 [Hypsibius exemplaris]
MLQLWKPLVRDCPKNKETFKEFVQVNEPSKREQLFSLQEMANDTNADEPVALTDQVEESQNDSLPEAVVIPTERLKFIRYRRELFEFEATFMQMAAIDKH